MRAGDWEEAVDAGGRRYIVTAPAWAAWQAALDLASPEGRADPQLLLEECLLTCLRAEDSSPVSRAELRALPAPDGDRLLSAALELIDAQREALQLTSAREGDGIVIRAGEGALRLRSWTFGERNDALRKSLRLQGGRVGLDLSRFEREMIACCVTIVEGPFADAALWPVPLGEIAMRGLDALNGLQSGEAELLAACLRTGAEHPDLALIRLCRTFGLSPEQTEQMDAKTGIRLLAGLDQLEHASASSAARSEAASAADFGPHSEPSPEAGLASISAPASALASEPASVSVPLPSQLPSLGRLVAANPSERNAASVGEAEGVTRILVHDD